MFKKIAVLVVVFLVASFVFFVPHSQYQQEQSSAKFVGKLPIVQEKNPLLTRINTGPPIDHTGADYSKWLQAACGVAVSKGVGAGTLCYYDVNKNLAYVASCGHLWKGTMRANQQDIRAKVVFWYCNKKKLQKPKTYPAKVIFYSNDIGYDCSLLVFKPDWIPQLYFPIATSKRFTKGEKLHSTGWDTNEIADYIVEYVGTFPGPQGAPDFVTKYNSPRPGRSGGGLIDQDGYITGICKATSDNRGTGVGYFTPLNALRAIYNREGYGFLLNKSRPDAAKRIPILDHNKPDKRYRDDYIIYPNS